MEIINSRFGCKINKESEDNGSKMKNFQVIIDKKIQYNLFRSIMISLLLIGMRS